MVLEGARRAEQAALEHACDNEVMAEAVRETAAADDNVVAAIASGQPEDAVAALESIASMQRAVLVASNGVAAARYAVSAVEMDLLAAQASGKDESILHVLQTVSESQHEALADCLAAAVRAQETQKHVGF